MKQVLSSLDLLVLLTIAGGPIVLVEGALAQQQTEVETTLIELEAEIVPDDLPPDSSVLALSDTAEAQPATTVDEWLAQIEATLIQITDIQVAATEAGMQVVIEADGALVIPTPTELGNALVFDIPDAALSTPFQEFEPTEGIALVEATELSGDVVRVVITGNDAVPVVEVSTDTTGLVLGVMPGVAQAGVDDDAIQTDDDAIQIVVTGAEGSRYVVPNAATATRTDTPLRDIPQSIQVIPREVLEDQQVNGLEDALRNVSGVFLGSNFGGAGLEIITRGFDRTTVLRGGFRQPTVAGFPELANYEQIEVLRGPSSVLYGRSEPGGIINLVPSRPLSEPFYEVELEVGNRAYIQPRFDISGPLTEDGSVLYRLSGLYSRADSFRDFDQELERFSIVPTLTWKISEDTDLTIRLEYLDNESSVDSGIVAFGDGVADVPRDRITDEPDNLVEFEYLEVGYDFEHRFSNNWRIRNAFRYFNEEQVGRGTFTVDFDENTGNVFRIFVDSPSARDTYELQTNVVGKFSTGSIDHTLLFGVDYTRAETPERTALASFAVPPLNIFDPVYGFPKPDPDTLIPFVEESGTTRDEVGIYVQNQIDILDNLIVVLGGRFDFYDQTVPNAITNTVTNVYEEAFSPRVGMVYQPIEELSLYASYGRSFLPGLARTFSGEVIEPEEGEQFEVGARAELLEGRFIGNLALYNLTKQNVAVPDPAFPGLGFSIASGERRSRGIELDLAGEISPGWNVIANYAYTDTEITEDDINEGNQFFGVPEHSANLWTTYEVQNGDLQGLSLGIGFNFLSERFGDDANSFELDSYFLTNAAIAYQRNNWRAAVNFRNLFDVNYIEAAANSRLNVEPGEGFTVIGSLSVEF